MSNKYFQSKRPGSQNNHDEDYRNKGIGLTVKMNRASSNDREKELDSKHSLSGSQSQGQLVKNLDRFAQKSQTPTGQTQIKVPEYGKRAELSEYQKLHEKLNSL